MEHHSGLLDRVEALERAMHEMESERQANAELRARLDGLAPALSPAPR